MTITTYAARSAQPRHLRAAELTGDFVASGSVVEIERTRSDWRFTLPLQIIKRMNEYPAPSFKGAYNFVSWLRQCPPVLPAPSVAVGDDGSIVAEWDVGSRHFHVSFFEDESEGYYFEDSGREESTDDLSAEPGAAMRAFNRILSALQKP